MSHIAVQIVDGRRYYYVLADRDASWSFVYGELSRILNKPEDAVRVSRSPGSAILAPDAPIDDLSGSGATSSSVMLMTRLTDEGEWTCAGRETLPSAPQGAMPKLPPSLIRYINELKPNLPV